VCCGVCAEVCCSVLRCVCGSVWQCLFVQMMLAMIWARNNRESASCGVLQCVAVCLRKCVAVCCGVCAVVRCSGHLSECCRQ